MEVQRGEWLMQIHTLLIPKTCITHQVREHLGEKMISNYPCSFLRIHSPLDTSGALTGELWSGGK